jgi:AcrR family transcriptional regulator
VPRLWNKTIEGHRREVREAVLDTTAGLVARHGLRAVTMSQIADEAGIGRATLYKYFPDVESILTAWHERQVARHLEQLSHLDHGDQPWDRLAAVLEAYASMAHDMEGRARAKFGRHASELATVLHRGAHVARAQEHLVGFMERLIAEAAAKHQVRDDVSPEELARYCLHALTAASGVPSKAAVRRLVTVTLAGLRPAS